MIGRIVLIAALSAVAPPERERGVSYTKSRTAPENFDRRAEHGAAEGHHESGKEKDQAETGLPAKLFGGRFSCCLIQRPFMKTIAVQKKSRRVPITVDSETLGGEPVFTGTRVPVKSLFEHLEANCTLDEFLEWFPSVSREAATAVLLEAHRLTVERTRP